MTARDPAFRCTVASEGRGDLPAGTASTVRSFLLIEHAGPWGVDALRDARLPDGVGPAVAAAARRARVRPLLIRRPGRPGRPAGPAGIRVFAAHAGPAGAWVETTVLPDPHALLDLDLDALGSGRSLGLTPHDGLLLCVCTHGRHDACCAERGRPVVAALAQVHPDATWEVSHLGGDRFAGNMLALPQGLYYGRLDPASALTVADELATGRLELDHLRGRASYPMAVQAAEIALRRHLDETRADAVRLVARGVEEDVTTAGFVVDGVRWEVEVRTSYGVEQLQLTCRATRDNPVPRHEVVGFRKGPIRRNG